MSDTTARADAPVRDATQRPLALVVGELISDAQTLARKEVELAKAEVSAEVKKLVQGIVLMAVVAVIGLFILAFLGVTTAKTIDNFVGEGWAWLITTAIYGGVAAILGFLGYRRISNASLAPTKAQASVKETSDWVRTQVRR